TAPGAAPKSPRPAAPARGRIVIATCVALAAASTLLAAGRVRSGSRFDLDASAFSFRFSNIARAAGLDGAIVYGGATSNKYLLETTGTGVAAIDYDSDGWLDLFFVNGTTLEGFAPG